jgi:hypothetical protein
MIALVIYVIGLRSDLSSYYSPNVPLDPVLLERSGDQFLMFQ